jgi:hypothetical protein
LLARLLGLDEYDVLERRLNGFEPANMVELKRVFGAVKQRSIN